MTEEEKTFPYYVDAKRYESDQKNLTGAVIKARADIPDSYQLFLEEEGDRPDRAISDGEPVDLKGRVKHLYAVPPATFGLQ